MVNGTVLEKQLPFNPTALAVMPGCNHDSCSPPEDSTDHFDFCIKTAPDVLRLFIPNVMDRHFQPDFDKQDATNLLNMIEALNPDIQPNASYVRNQVRNQWAHQTDMDGTLFETYMKAIRKLVTQIGTKLYDEHWEKIHRMAKQWY